MLMPILGFVVGMILLMKLSDYAVEYSIQLSKLTGIMKLTIGVIIIALMTSLPELAVSITSSINKASNLVFGTMVGSNIADILIVLGGAAAVYGIGVGRYHIKDAAEIMIITSLLLIYGLAYGYGDVFGLLGLIIFLFFSDRLLHRRIEKEGGNQKEIGKIVVTAVKLVLVITFILLSAELVTKSSIELSNIFRISETLIGATIISITTSFPELMVALAAAKRRETEIIFGTVFGSCFINISLVLGIGSLIFPISIGIREMFLIASLFVTYLIALGFMYYKIDRFEGLIMSLLYILFILVMSSFG